MAPDAHIDFETRSTTDLKKSGVFRYAEDVNTRPWLFSYRLGRSGPKRRWHPGDPDPIELLVHIANGGMVKAHNAAFERTIWNMVVVGRMCPHWPMIRIEQQDCTLARAAAIDHPQALELLCNALRTKTAKDMAGNALMKKMMRPRRYNEDGSITWWDDLADIARLGDYCDTDVEVETEVDGLVPPLTDAERLVWQLDQRINERGVHIDINAVAKVTELVEICKKMSDVAMRQVTNRMVPKCSSVMQIIAFLNSRGIETTTLQKGDQDDLMYIADLRNDIPARQAVELRRAASKTSTAKYKAMLTCMSRDNRMRGLLAYHGAGPGRWAGRLVQPQNFPRVDEEEEHQITWLHEMLADPSYTARGIYDMIEAVHGPLRAMVLMSRALRSMITAAPGNELIGGDFSNIEGRVSAWLAGEEWKLDAFRAYDAGTGPDLYALAYARSFGVGVETVGKGRKRQIGKVEELAFGFQGAVGSFIGMGDNYNLNPYDVSPVVQAATTPEQWAHVTSLFHIKGTNHYGYQEREWTALKTLVINWRAAHPAIVSTWWELQDAAVEAVSQPGAIIYCCKGKVQYYFDGQDLWCVLPGGRSLCYPSAHIITTVQTLTGKDGSQYERPKHTVWFFGIDPIKHIWCERNLYGGLQFENIVQATARDVMVGAMFRVEAAGFPLILTVHDELLAEVLKSLGKSIDEFEYLMGEGETWTQGLPISVKVWRDQRYVK